MTPKKRNIYDFAYVYCRAILRFFSLVLFMHLKHHENTNDIYI